MTQDDRDRLTRIESKVDTLVEVRLDHEPRIRKLEQWRWYTLGACAALLAIFKFLLH